MHEPYEQLPEKEEKRTNKQTNKHKFHPIYDYTMIPFIIYETDFTLKVDGYLGNEGSLPSYFKALYIFTPYLYISWSVFSCFLPFFF